MGTVTLAMVTPPMPAGTNSAMVAVWRVQRDLKGVTGTGVDAVGVLEVREGRIRFRTLQGITDFDVPVAHATITIPWYRMGTGARIAVRGAEPRLYLFSPPRRHHGTMQALEEFFLGPAAGVRTGFTKKIIAGRAARSALRAALDGSHGTELA